MTNENNEQPSASEASTISNQQTNKTIEKLKKPKTIKKPENAIPRGQPKSNRPWKTPKAK